MSRFLSTENNAVFNAGKLSDIPINPARPTDGQVLAYSATAGSYAPSNAAGGGSGTVTTVSVTTANGVSGSVANPTSTPAISLTLGAITPTSVAASGTVTGSNLSGTNTGDQTITLTGDVTGSGTGSFTATLANVPSATPHAGSNLHTAIAAPGTPAAGKGLVYVDSTSKNLAVKNDAGTVNHGVQTKAAVASNWIRSIADDGSSTASQPAFSDVSGSVSATQMPALTGDVTSTAGTVATTVGKINGTALSGLATGLLKNTTGTGVPSIAAAGTDYQAVLVSATNIKTINGSSVLGSGDLVVTGTAADIPLTLMAPTIDETITAGYSAYVSDFYEIASTFMLEVGNASVFEVG